VPTAWRKRSRSQGRRRSSVGAAGLSQQVERAAYLLKKAGQIFDIAEEPFNKIVAGIATRNGETELQTAIQKAFDSMKSDGTYKAQLAKWGLEGDAIEWRGPGRMQFDWSAFWDYLIQPSSVYLNGLWLTLSISLIAAKLVADCRAGQRSDWFVVKGRSVSAAPDSSQAYRKAWSAIKWVPFLRMVRLWIAWSAFWTLTNPCYR
jgi:hypothetical protein